MVKVICHKLWYLSLVRARKSEVDEVRSDIAMERKPMDAFTLSSCVGCTPSSAPDADVALLACCADASRVMRCCGRDCGSADNQIASTCIIFEYALCELANAPAALVGVKDITTEPSNVGPTDHHGRARLRLAAVHINTSEPCRPP
jgi:hypothetical protein